MGFDDFKVIETCIVKLEERLLRDLREDQLAKRRKLLKEEAKGDAYWQLLKAQTKDENDLLRRISKSVVAFYKVSASVYQGWIETYLEKAENHAKLMEFRQELRNLSLSQLEGPAKEFS